LGCNRPSRCTQKARITDLYFIRSPSTVSPNVMCGSQSHILYRTRKSRISVTFYRILPWRSQSRYIAFAQHTCKDRPGQREEGRKYEQCQMHPELNMRTVTSLSLHRLVIHVFQYRQLSLVSSDCYFENPYLLISLKAIIDLPMNYVPLRASFSRPGPCSSSSFHLYLLFSTPKESQMEQDFQCPLSPQHRDVPQ